LFETAGRSCSSAALFDLLTPAGSRPLLSGLGHGSRREGDRILVEGLALGSGRPERLVVDLPDGSAVLIDAVGLDWQSIVGIDPSADLHHVRGSVPASSPARSVRELLRRAIGHQLVGIADRLTEELRDYVVTRTQFGRPIGSWQSVQHQLADAHVELVAARSTLATAWADPNPMVTTAAAAQAGRAARFAVTASQQLHGAIGFTWEHGLHQSVRRAQLLDGLLGGDGALEDKLGTELLSTGTLEAAVVGF
jgi:hypothetical protein